MGLIWKPVLCVLFLVILIVKQPSASVNPVKVQEFKSPLDAELLAGLEKYLIWYLSLIKLKLLFFL